MNRATVLEELQFLTGRAVPNADEVVGRTRHQSGLVGAKRKTGYIRAMRETQNLFAVIRVPHLHRLSGCHRHPGVILIEGESRRGLGNCRVRAQHLAVCRIP